MERSPFHAWNLRRNPFGQLTREERGHLAVVDRMQQWLEWLKNTRAAIEFVGPCGHGKSTHLLAIMSQLPQAEYVYYPPSGARPALPRSRPALVDEAQRMGYFRRRQMLRGPGPLVIGTHCSLAHLLQKAGFQVLTVDVELPKTAAMVSEMLNRRIEASRWQPHLPVTHIDDAFATRLLDRFGSNVRNIEHFLYEQFQATVREHAPWPPVI